MAQGLKLTLVTVLTTVIVRLVQHASLAMGEVKCHTWPPLTVRLLAHVSTGGLVLITFTVWLQVLVLLQQSMACHVRVMVCGQEPLVTELRMVGWTLGQQGSTTVGCSKIHAVPQSTVLLVGQLRKDGGGQAEV